MGERKKRALRVDFDCTLKVEFHGTKVTTDAGLLLYRELDDVLGLTSTGEQKLIEKRRGKNTTLSLLTQFRQSVFSRLAGYDDTNDAERLRNDPAMKKITSEKKLDRVGASTSQMGRFETDGLTLPENLAALTDLSGQWIDRVNDRSEIKHVILDIDSSESPTHGKQEGTAFNGHFGKNCYHPLFVFNGAGDLERSILRPGNVHSAKDWHQVLDPVIQRYKKRGIRIYSRSDAAFASPEYYEYHEAEGIGYVIRLPANNLLQKEIEHLLTRPVGRPPKKPHVFYEDFPYQAATWSKPRRVVAKIEWHRGELFPRVGFIVTNLPGSPKSVVKFYNKRGTAEQWIKEGKYAIKWTRLSCHGFQQNAVRLQLFALAYNLANFMRTLALPQEIKHWSLTTLREKLIKIGAKVVASSRYVTFQMAEVAVTKRLFAMILSRIRRWRLVPA